MFKTFLPLLFIFTFFLACSQKEVISYEPKWLNKPNLEGKVGAIGSSKPQFKGEAVQRKVAISRAIDELAQQSGVHVDTIIIRNEKSTALQVRSSTEVKSTQTTKGISINAHIQETWTDPRTKELHIWLIKD
ncbi:hypothetical protein JHD50_12990 [Sulfurimonas sp. MAG313]|nr:hypothetical protein [Sulfurimonas sp. MAG313]MDF1882204.1 hypothetical protein [Sulfurimonas sp. MAG313]